VPLFRPGAATGPESLPTNRWLALAVLCVPLLITSLDTTVLNVALPTLVRRLHATDGELQWIVDAYVLVFGGLMLVSGSLADRVGRKRTFLAGLAVFALGSMWAALSGSASMLIAARASMGIGGTLIMPATLSIITNTFTDPAERQRALGIWAGTTGAGVALGPIVGGLLLAHFAWGSVFLINVPIAVLGLVLGVRLVPNSLDPHAARTDVVGGALSVAGLGMLLWAIIEAPVHGWSSGIVIGAGGGGLLVVIGFVVWEARSSHPMLKLAFFRNPRFSAAVVSVGTMMFGLMGMLFVLTQFLQFQLGYSAFQAGFRMLPAAGGIVLVAPLSPVVVRWFGTKLIVVAGLLLIAGGLWQISGVSVHSTYSAQLPGGIMIGIGTGLVMPACVGSLMATLPVEHTGIGSATNGTFVQIGGALGVAIVGSLLSTRYVHRMNIALRGHHTPASIHAAIVGSVGAALGVAERVGGAVGLSLAHQARSAFISGMDLSLRVTAGVVLAGVVVALLMLPARATAAAKASKTGW
jgi:EmrB/QacA subfamily drug resistance transporter